MDFTYNHAKASNIWSSSWQCQLGNWVLISIIQKSEDDSFLSSVLLYFCIFCTSYFAVIIVAAPSRMALIFKLFRYFLDWPFATSFADSLLLQYLNLNFWRMYYKIHVMYLVFKTMRLKFDVRLFEISSAVLCIHLPYFLQKLYTTINAWSVHYKQFLS